MWSVIIAFVLAEAAPGVAPSPPNDESVQQIVARVQAHYDQLRDFEADFTQRVVHQIMHKTIEEYGTVAFKRPGRMRWEYEDPEKLLVTDGETSYFYVPEDRQVIVSHNPGGALALAPESPLSVIMGETRLVDAFDVTDSDTPPAMGGRVLRLIPRRPQEEFREAEIEVNPTDGQVLRVSLLDYQGNRTEFFFENIRENRGLSDWLFRFEIPPGVDIVTASDAAPLGESR